MAEAVVSFLLTRLGELLISEATFLYGVRDEINEIQRLLISMQCFLEEADKRQIKDKRVRNWVAEMKELAYKTEDVIETYALDVSSPKPKSDFKNILRRCTCILSEGASLHKIGNEIDSIKGKLNSLAADLHTFGITSGLDQGQTSNSVDLTNQRIFYPHNVDKDFVGMGKDIEQLIYHLKEEDKGCEVVSICGMGGQGKSTVAGKLYYHADVRAHFQTFAWFCVTQQLNKKKVLKSILKQLLPTEKKEDVSRMEDEEIVYELHKYQQEKKCLVVLDDIWTTNHWKTLSCAFPTGVTESGSKILLTTRNKNVAQIGHIHELSPLTEEEGWELLSKKAFSQSPGNGVLSEMESIGKKMIVRCKGLPLAVSTLGGMLRGKTLRQWDMISRDIDFHLAGGEGVDDYHTVTHILGLSYDSLPLHLKQCFLCLANYKEDEEINVNELYLFWIAEGLISHEHKASGEMTLNVAERYLDELAHRSLVQVEPWTYVGKSWSKFEKCRVHDLIRDLCLSKVKEEKVIRIIDSVRRPDHDSKASNNRIRRLCIHSYDHMDELGIDRNVIPQIRSLLLFTEFNHSDWAENFISSMEKFKLLRVLIVNGLKISGEDLRSMVMPVCLKYLSFRNCVVGGALPSSIGNLRNLETLDFRVRDAALVRVPNVVCKLKQLKHLYLPPNIGLTVVASEKVRLNGLNELELIEGFDSRYCYTPDLIGLSKIKVFEGTIIVDSQNPTVLKDIIAFINSKELYYSRLTIGSEVGVPLVELLECSFIDYLHIDAPIIVLPKEYDSNRLSRRITFLELTMSCETDKDPMILLEKLPNLCHLKLISCTLSPNMYMCGEMVFSAMGFPRLQTLWLYFLPTLTNLRVDQGAMPNLSELYISRCTELKMLPDGLRFLTSLKHLTIEDMRTAFTDRVDVGGQDFYKVSHIPTITIR